MLPIPFITVVDNAELDTFNAFGLISGVKESPFVIEFGVEEGVVDDAKTPDTESVSIFIVALPVKSNPLLIGAVVSVG